MLELKNITGGYTKNSNILNGVSFNLKQGEVIAVVGQNGSGKSTLAKAIFNLLPIKSGKTYLNGKLINDVPTQKMNSLGVFYMMQGGSVFPQLSVKENIEFVCKTKGYLEGFIIPESLKKQWNKKAGLLSGGQRHQLALIMTLINKPNVVILDEPSSGLSPNAKLELYQLLENIKKQTNLSILLIEQNVQEAIKFSDKVLLLSNGEIKLFEEIIDENEIINKVQSIYF